MKSIVKTLLLYTILTIVILLAVNHPREGLIILGVFGGIVILLFLLSLTFLGGDLYSGGGSVSRTPTSDEDKRKSPFPPWWPM